MDMLLPLGAVSGLVILSTALGLAWRATRGRTSARSTGEVIVPESLGSDAVAGWGRAATLLQFSTELCSTCPQTRRVLAAEASARPGVAHVDVDVTERPDLVTRFSVLQTPTTLLIDATGVVRARWGGSVRPPAVREALGSVLAPAHAHGHSESAHDPTASARERSTR
ncbi:TlpA family protein disulfide reductase [Cnuibacter sp. UC19_7]|uniref:TlpA family protein disulfide reductase n=1 Tax=Cnuibacter sp. UC19_7 TaxID=3350166 RepID=UPI00367206CA